MTVEVLTVCAKVNDLQKESTSGKLSIVNKLFSKLPVLQAEHLSSWLLAFRKILTFKSSQADIVYLHDERDQ